MRPALATSYAYVNPVVAMALGVLLLGERITATEWIATPVILAGVALVMLARGRAQTTPSPAETAKAASAAASPERLQDRNRDPLTRMLA